MPHAGWLDAIHFDKWVHIGLFAVLIFLWRASFNLDLDHYNSILLLAAFVYGLSVEVIQKYWIPNRSFDLFDLLADMTGAIAGLAVWFRVYKK